MSLTGTILGYDPGGNFKHGVVSCTFSEGRIVNKNIYTMETTDDVINLAISINDLLAVGVDTLTCWSTGNSGWRPADRWLKQNYNAVSNSIVSANSLFGSMGLNGMSVLFVLRDINPDLLICETHPKVLYFALSDNIYNYDINHETMDLFLSKKLQSNITTNNDHEWDAAISVYAVMQGIEGFWVTDLHAQPHLESERLIEPCGKTYYWWP